MPLFRRYCLLCCFLFLSVNILTAQTTIVDGSQFLSNSQGVTAQADPSALGDTPSVAPSMVSTDHAVLVNMYCLFLNAVAATDEHHLYSDKMGQDGLITRSGSPGNYSYSCTPEVALAPIGYVDWFSMARFCNWMEHDLPETKKENDKTTETGTYALNKLTDKSNNFSSVEIKEGALHMISNDAAILIGTDGAPSQAGMDLNMDYSIASSRIGFCMTELTPMPDIPTSGAGSTGNTTSDPTENGSSSGNDSGLMGSSAGSTAQDAPPPSLSKYGTVFMSGITGNASPLFKIDLVTIGGPSNAGDSANSKNSQIGAVDYIYQIGKFDITATQYCAFLNAVAVTDANNLFNSGMQTDLSVACIARSGESGSYSYSIIKDPNDPPTLDRGQFPITYVTYFNALRFCNWMANYQPTGEQNQTTTENGSYDLSSGNPVLNKGAKWRLPTENEWYKTAYYAALSARYWTYPTDSLAQPGNSMAAVDNQKDSPKKNCNYMLNSTLTTAAAPFLTPVGTFINSPGPFGTFDMGGNVAQWTSGLGAMANGATGVIVRGGSWMSTSATQLESYSGFDILDPNIPKNTIGFRVVCFTPPEPTLSGAWDQAEQLMGQDFQDYLDPAHNPDVLYTIMNYHVGLGYGFTAEAALRYGGMFVETFYKILLAFAKMMFGWMRGFLPEWLTTLLDGIPEAAGGAVAGAVGETGMAIAGYAGAAAQLGGAFLYAYGPIIGGTIISSVFAVSMYEVNADPNMSPRMAIGGALYAISGGCRILGAELFKALQAAGFIAVDAAAAAP